MLAVVAAACSAGPGAPPPSPKSYEQTFGPDYAPEPPAGQRTRVDDATISADGRTLTLAFTGGGAYATEAFCSTDYAPWVAAAGADLEVAVVLVSHDPQAAAYADRVLALRDGKLTSYDPEQGFAPAGSK